MRIIHRPFGREPALAVAVQGDLRSSDSRPVLLVHGMGGDHSSWRGLTRTLRAAGRPVVAVDLRGHGRSGHADSYRLDDFRDDLRVIADELGLEQFDLIGHSLGAHTALRLAMAEPERIGRLVAEEPPPMPRHQADLDEGIVPSASLGERLRGVRALARNPRPYLAFDRVLPDAVGRQFESIDTGWWDGLEKVTAPTLVISGGPASFLPSRHLESVATALPTAEFRAVACGHSVHRDRPADFATLVLDHLRTPDRPASTE